VSTSDIAVGAASPNSLFLSISKFDKEMRKNKDLFEGTGKFGRLLYTANLVSSWIPALDNGKVEQRLSKEV
jgi:thiamine monophosphate kinase